MQRGGSCQFGPVVALEISPFFPNVILTAGGWDWSLWKEDFLEAPLMRSPFAPVQYTCAAWSPTRPGACLQTAHAAPCRGCHMNVASNAMMLGHPAGR